MAWHSHKYTTTYNGILQIKRLSFVIYNKYPSISVGLFDLYKQSQFFIWDFIYDL